MENQFIFCSLFSFFLSLMFAAIISRFGLYVGLVDAPNERSSHKTPTPRSGGIGIWLAFAFLVMFFIGSQLFALLAGIVGLIGLLADYSSVREMIRLVLQLFVSSVLVGLFVGIDLHNDIVLFAFCVIFITGTANFYNFMDGIDGIAGLAGFVGFGFMAFFSFYMASDHEIALFSTILSLGCLGFLTFNFPKAKVFMGDTGSIFLGFMFASFAIKLSLSTSMFLCVIMFMCMFYADALITIACRARRGENLIIAHRSHLYQYLSNELKIPHWKVSLAYTLAQSVFALMALVSYKMGIIWQTIVFVFFMVMFMVAYRCIKGIKSKRLLS